MFKVLVMNVLCVYNSPLRHKDAKKSSFLCVFKVLVMDVLIETDSMV